MATLTGKITDVTNSTPENISSITVKAPSVRVGSGTDVIVSSPAQVTFSKTTGDITISGLTGGLSWLYIEGDGWSDSIPLAVAEGMITLVEAVANATGVPGMADYLALINNANDAIQDFVDGLELDTYGGFQPASVSVDTLLAGGTNSNSRVYYRMASWGDTPNGDAGVLDVTNSGYSFVQVFYSTSNNAIYQRTITDRSHIVDGQWVFGEWEKLATQDDVDAAKWHRGELGAADLNTVTTPGTYNQGNLAYDLFALNYPEKSTGVLTVSPLGATNIAQVYIARSGNVWSRMTTSNGTIWPQWSQGGGLPLAGALEQQNLDDIKATGVYHQSFPDLPTVERNYPEKFTGVLTVSPLGATNIAQVYIARSGNVWSRMTTSNGTIWPQWSRSGGAGGAVSLTEELPPSTSWETARSLTTYDQGERFLDSMVDQLPGVSLVELGESGQGRPIRGLYVGDTTKPVVIIECAIHGDENSGREAAFIWAKEVAKSVPSWMEHICFLIIPTANPDSVNIRRGNGFGTDINRSWINQTTSEVRALTGAVDAVNPVFYLSMHEKIDRAWEVELGGNHYPWRAGEPHHTVSETVHGAVLSALSEIEPKTRDYGFKMVETDDPATGRAYLGETLNIPVLLAEIGSYNGPGSWSEDVPHPNRFRAPMDKRIKHCIAIFDTVANTMAEIVSGEPLAVPSKTSYPQVAGLDDAINSRIDAAKWYRPMLRSGDTLDDKRGEDAVGVYPVTAAVTGLPSTTQGWVEVFYNSDTSSTTQRFFAASWAVGGEWEREHWAGAWREWRRIDADSVVSEVTAQLDELRARVEALEEPTT